MASVALQPTRRTLLASLRAISTSFGALPNISVTIPPWRPNTFSFPRPQPIPSLLASLIDLWFPPIVLAVPKKKVSHSRKSMRSANKGLKDKTNIVSCAACGHAKLANNLCPNCYSQISREFKAKARGESGPESWID